ncbi:MAG: PEP-CTERM sorting domain-containing protein [Planctomycetota bacterium]
MTAQCALGDLIITIEGDSTLFANGSNTLDVFAQFEAGTFDDDVSGYTIGFSISPASTPNGELEFVAPAGPESFLSDANYIFSGNSQQLVDGVAASSVTPGGEDLVSISGDAVLGSVIFDDVGDRFLVGQLDLRHTVLAGTAQTYPTELFTITLETADFGFLAEVNPDPVTFGVTVTAVPEPSGLAMLALLVSSGYLVTRHRRKGSPTP